MHCKPLVIFRIDLAFFVHHFQKDLPVLLVEPCMTKFMKQRLEKVFVVVQICTIKFIILILERGSKAVLKSLLVENS